METVETGRLPEPRASGTPRWRSDPYRLIEYFHVLHDLQRVEAGTTGSRLYMEEAAATRVATVTSAFAAAADAAARRERNMARTVRALYIVGRANRVPAWLGAPISSRHEVAIRASLRADARARDASLQTVEQLRVAAGEAVAHEEALRRKTQWRDTREWWNATVAPRLDARSVTVSSLDATQAAYVALLSSGGLTPSDMQLLDMTGAEVRAMAGRVRLAALVLGAPAALPAVMPFVSADTPLPREDLPGRPSPPAPRLNPDNTPGMEIPMSAERPVLAAASGTVAFSGELRGARNVVIIAHDKNLYSVYSHLAARTVREGDRISRGDTVGRPGLLPASRDTGVHFEVRRGEKPVKPGELLGDTPAAEAVGAGN